MSGYGKRDKSSLELAAPIHPGRAMKVLLLPQRDMRLESVSAKSGLPMSWLRDFTNGETEMTRAERSKLKNVFGEAATTLYRMQLNYNHYQAFGRWLPPAGRHRARRISLA